MECLALILHLRVAKTLNRFSQAEFLSLLFGKGWFEGKESCFLAASCGFDVQHDHCLIMSSIIWASGLALSSIWAETPSTANAGTSDAATTIMWLEMLERHGGGRGRAAARHSVILCLSALAMRNARPPLRS